jgi:hypothetical protein
LIKKKNQIFKDSDKNEILLAKWNTMYLEDLGKITYHIIKIGIDKLHTWKNKDP